MNGLCLTIYNVLVISSVLADIFVSELALSNGPFLTPVVDAFLSGGEKGELLREIMLSFLEPSDDDSLPDKIRLS